MCYDLSFAAEGESIFDYFPELLGAGQMDFQFDPRPYAIAQGYPKWPIITNSGDKYQLNKFNWGVIPSYMDTDEKIKKGRPFMCNATCEKMLHDNRSVWFRIRKNRCLIPATGFFEPHKEVWSNESLWFYIYRPDRKMFFLPGLYHYASHRPDVETGEVPGTFALITRPANDTMAAIHNNTREEGSFRMPLMLPKELELEWLDPELTFEGMQQICDYAIPDEELAYHHVKNVRKRNTPKDETILEPEFNEQLSSLLPNRDR